MREIPPVILAVVVALIAIAASVHVVLRKRQVGAAVAWVGLIWLSPLIGVVLYLFFGINRIHRRASALRAETEPYRGSTRLPDVSLDELARTLGPENEHLTAIARLGNEISVRPLLGGDRITPLRNGDEAYPAMLDAIGAARRSVTLTTYIFDNDRAGQAFLEALRAAVVRGVEVRVLIDAVGARYSFPPIVRALRRADIPVARFMPAAVHWKMPYFNLRNHRKIVVVDGEVGFTGGINIREGHWLAVNPSHPALDLHFRIEGPVVAELQEVFAEDWTFTTGERLEGPLWFPRLEPRGDSIARGISDGPDVDFEQLQSMILGALSAAKRRVDIMTPYFVPDQVLITTLNLTALRGVEVNIILPEENNLVLVHWASSAHWEQIVGKGPRILLTPPPFDHSKLMLVDGAWALLGSANWDPRSLQLNFEFNVECYDRALVEELRRLVDERVRSAREVTPEEIRTRPLPVRLRNGLARLLSPYL